MTKTSQTIEIHGVPWRMVLTWSGSRYPVVTGVEVTAVRTEDGQHGQINATVWRELPIGHLIAAHRPQPQPLDDPEPHLGRPRVHGRAHYEAVAATYRAAVEAGEPAVRAVADRFEVEQSAARRWVHVARHRHGLLPLVRPGQAG